VNDEHRPGCGEHRRERREIRDRQWIDEPDTAVGRRELQQREALGIVVKAVALGVERDLGLAAEALRQS
jgi:hypothetical protein